jgi:hypothetical protein
MDGGIHEREKLDELKKAVKLTTGIPTFLMLNSFFSSAVGAHLRLRCSIHNSTDAIF